MLRLISMTTGALALALALPPATAADPSPQVVRGEYLATQVAMCVQCHSPRSESGVLDTTRLFMGATMPLKAPFSGMEFAMSTPRLRGLPSGFHEEDVVRLLRTGMDQRGRTPRPPMPPFRMNEEDARAIAAYLASLR
ncbi:MAG: c-type cytochrome [Vicinamibacterales bacterium]